MISERKETKMLKLNASYSKNVPAESEFSSQSYHASIEVELPDGLTQDQLNDKIHETFAMVRDSVEAELHGNGSANPEGSAPRNQQNQPRLTTRSLVQCPDSRCGIHAFPESSVRLQLRVFRQKLVFFQTGT